MRSQSSIEYLTVYMWAILITAVVLGALFMFGVFGQNASSPRVAAGTCYVSRPNGPYTNQFVTLQGECQGGLPQYVGAVSGNPAQQGYFYVPDFFNRYVFSDTVPFTINFWVNMNPPSDLVLHTNDIFWFTNNNNAFQLRIVYSACSTATSACLDFSSTHGHNDYIGGFNTPSTSLSFGKWHMITLTHSSVGVETIYVDRTQVGSGSVGIDSAAWTGNLIMYQSIFCCEGNYAPWPTSFGADVQVYNTSLSANEIQALYLEGIGGAPLVLQNLAGWWPLNGDAKDYSGNNNNGAMSGVSYTSQWTNGYALH